MRILVGCCRLRMPWACELITHFLVPAAYWSREAGKRLNSYTPRSLWPTTHTCDSCKGPLTIPTTQQLIPASLFVFAAPKTLYIPQIFSLPRVWECILSAARPLLVHHFSLAFAWKMDSSFNFEV